MVEHSFIPWSQWGMATRLLTLDIPQPPRNGDEAENGLRLFERQLNITE
jgi:hypothetical protein